MKLIKCCINDAGGRGIRFVDFNTGEDDAPNVVDLSAYEMYEGQPNGMPTNIALDIEALDELILQAREWRGTLMARRITAEVRREEALTVEVEDLRYDSDDEDDDFDWTSPADIAARTAPVAEVAVFPPLQLVPVEGTSCRATLELPDEVDALSGLREEVVPLILVVAPTGTGKTVYRTSAELDLRTGR